MPNVNVTAPNKIKLPLHENPIIDIDLPEDEYLKAYQTYVDEQIVKPMFQNHNQTFVDNQPRTTEQLAEYITYWRHFKTRNHSTPQYEYAKDVVRQLYPMVSRYPKFMTPHVEADKYTNAQLFEMYTSPYPSTTIIYEILTDYVPAIEKYFQTLHVNDRHKDTISLALSGIILEKPLLNDTLFVHCRSFNEIQTIFGTIQTMVHQNGAYVPQKTHKDINDLINNPNANDLMHAFLIPKDDSDVHASIAPFSTNRIIMNAIHTCIQNDPDNIFKTQITENGATNPEVIAFINLEEMNASSPQDIRKEIQNLNNAVQQMNTFKFIKIASVQNLSTAVSSQTKQTTNPNGNNGGDLNRRVDKKRKLRLSNKGEQLKKIYNIVSRAKTNTLTQNSHVTQKTTYARPNRRKQDDHNLPGRARITSHLYDLHIYLDVSGSISEADYKQAVMNVSKIAAKLNCNIYFSSWSHVVTEETLVKTANKKVDAIYNEITKIPKITGGTSIANVLADIHNRAERKQNSRRLYFIITDMEFNIPSNYTLSHELHSRIFYVPIMTRGLSEATLLKYTNRIKKQLKNHGYPQSARQMIL